MFSIRNLIKRKVVVAIVASVLSMSVPFSGKTNTQSIAQSRLPETERTPVTNRYGARGDRGYSTELWRYEIKRRYGIGEVGTPVTDRFGATKSSRSNTEVWRREIQRAYGLPNNPTPVTSRFGATVSRRPNTSLWAREIKRVYAIPNYPTPVTNRFGATRTRGIRYRLQRSPVPLQRPPIRRDSTVPNNPTPVASRVGGTANKVSPIKRNAVVRNNPTPIYKAFSAPRSKPSNPQLSRFATQKKSVVRSYSTPVNSRVGTKNTGVTNRKVTYQQRKPVTNQYHRKVGN